MTQDEAKALVGKRAAEMVQDGMAVGLGTGSTSKMFIEALGARVKSEGLKIRCVASSDASAELGRSLGMDVVTLNELPELDLYIDGADEVAPGLALIKGGGERCEDVCRGGRFDKDRGEAGEVSSAG
jgi:ribose 5-phosphate isomerase A